VRVVDVADVGADPALRPIADVGTLGGVTLAALTDQRPATFVDLAASTADHPVSPLPDRRADVACGAATVERDG
jgi:hypothetical protein